MSRYGDLEKLKDHYKGMIKLIQADTRVEFKSTNDLVIKTLERVCKDIDNEKSVDVAPVVHAHWEIVDLGTEDGDFEATCTHCKERFLNFFQDYCPHCGAKMDEEM